MVLNNDDGSPRYLAISVLAIANFFYGGEGGGGRMIMLILPSFHCQ